MSAENSPAAELAFENDARQWLAHIAELVHGGSVRREELLHHLDGFHDAMQQRFSRRHAGCFEEIVARAPWLSGSVHDLLHQETMLRQTLEAIRDQIRQMGTSPASLAALWGPLDEFTQRYLDDEAMEWALLQEAFPAPEWTEWP